MKRMKKIKKIKKIKKKKILMTIFQLTFLKVKWI